MAKKNPSTRWFFKDWHTDSALQLCSLAARGAWMEMLGICAEHDGYLLINGNHPSISALARYVGTTPAVMRRLIKELETAGVFSRTPEGVIFNRRMTRAPAHTPAPATPASAPAHPRASAPARSPMRRTNKGAHRRFLTPLQNPSSNFVPPAARAPERLNGIAVRAHDDENDGSWKLLHEALQLGQQTTEPEPSPVQRHMQWLQQHDPGSLELYIAAAMSDNPDDARRMFELVQQRIDAAG